MARAAKALKCSEIDMNRKLTGRAEWHGLSAAEVTASAHEATRTSPLCSPWHSRSFE